MPTVNTTTTRTTKRKRTLEEEDDHQPQNERLFKRLKRKTNNNNNRTNDAASIKKTTTTTTTATTTKTIKKGVEIVRTAEKKRRQQQQQQQQQQEEEEKEEEEEVGIKKYTINVRHANQKYNEPYHFRITEGEAPPSPNDLFGKMYGYYPRKVTFMRYDGNFGRGPRLTSAINIDAMGAPLDREYFDGNLGSWDHPFSHFNVLLSRFEYKNKQK